MASILAPLGRHLAPCWPKVAPQSGQSAPKWAKKIVGDRFRRASCDRFVSKSTLKRSPGYFLADLQLILTPFFAYFGHLFQYIFDEKTATKIPKVPSKRALDGTTLCSVLGFFFFDSLVELSPKIQQPLNVSSSCKDFQKPSEDRQT